MEYGWMRQWARDTLSNNGVEVPELHEVMNETVDSGKNSLWNIIESTVKQVIPKAVSSAQAALAQLSYSGSTGNFQSAEENITLSARFFKIVDQYPEKIGSPCYRSAFLNTFSGFVKCKDAVFSSTTATSTEEQAIEIFMNSGFYYE